MSESQDKGPDSGTAAAHTDTPPPVERPQLPPTVKPDPDPEPTSDEAPAGRVAVEYQSDDPGPVSLPGYLNPVPSIVTPGVVFVMDPEHLDDVLAGDRFTLVEGYDPAEHTPNGRLTDEELAAKLEAMPEAHASGIVETAEDRDHLVTLLDDYDKRNPQPPGTAGDVIEENDNRE